MQPADTEKPFLDHLEDLRGVLLRSLAALAVGMAICLPLSPLIFKALRHPLVAGAPAQAQLLQSLDVAGAFTLMFKVAFWFGLVLSLPLLIYLWGSFVLPALTAAEKQTVLRLFAAGGGLFVMGVALGFFYTLPLALRVMQRMHLWMGLDPRWTVSSYTAFVLQLLLGFGLAFELPVVLLLLGRLGFVCSRQLRRWRRHALIIILVVAAVLTPPDVLSQVIMAIPLIILYECCIWVMWSWEQHKRTESQ